MDYLMEHFFDFEAGTVYAFRIDGQTVVAQVKGRKGEYIVLDDPHQLTFMPPTGPGEGYQVGLMPFIPGMSEDKEVLISENALSGIANVNIELHSLYMQATTGLQISTTTGL